MATHWSEYQVFNQEKMKTMKISYKNQLFTLEAAKD